MSKKTSTDVDQFVREYLQSKGYSRALEALDMETGNGSNMHGIAGGGKSGLLNSTAESLYVLGINNGDASVYQREYDIFSSWVMNSLDMLKPFLEALSLAIFIHCYIGLIRIGAESEAREFWSFYFHLYEHIYYEELQLLHQLNYTQQLKNEDFLSSNLFVKCCLQHKFQVHVNSLSYQVLSHFLAMNDLALIASIINDKVQIHILSTTMSKTNHLFAAPTTSTANTTAAGVATGEGGQGGQPAMTIKAELESNMLIQLPGYNPIITRSSMFSKELLLGVPGTGILVKGLLDMFSSPLFRNLLVPDGKKELYKFYIDRLIRPRYLLNKIKDRKIRAVIEDMESKKRQDGTNGNVNGTNIDPNLMANKYKVSIDDELWTPLYTPAHNPLSSSSNTLPGSSSYTTTSHSSSSSSSTMISKEDGNEESSRPTTSTSAMSSSSSSATTTHMTGSASASTSVLTDGGDIFEPSVIFATIGNTYEGMTCMDMNSSITQIVTGHTDSIVRCWRVDEQIPSTTTSEDRRRWFGHHLPKESDHTWSLYDILPKTKDAFVSSMLQEHTTRQQSQQSQPLEVPYYPPSKIRRGNQDTSTAANVVDMQKYPRIELIGHRKPVYSVTQNATGRWIWSASADETIRLWDVSLTQCVQKYKCYAIPWCVVSNSLDYHFLSGNADATVTLYSVDRVTPLRMFTGHSSDVISVAWHPNHTLLLSGSDDRTLRIWDMRSTECVRLWQDTGSAVTSMSVAPSGNLLVAGTDRGTIHLYDIRSTRKLGIYYGHTGSIHSLAFAQNCLGFVSGSADCTVRVWDCAPAYETVGSVSGMSGQGVSAAAMISSTGLTTAGASTVAMANAAAGFPYGSTSHTASTSSSSSANTSNISGVSAGSMNRSPYPSTTLLPTMTTTTTNTTNSSSSSNPYSPTNGHGHPTTTTTSSSSSTAATATGTVGTGAGSSLLATTLKQSIPIFRPKHTFHTKATPVYYVNTTKEHVVYAGGPFTLSSTTTAANSAMAMTTNPVMQGGKQGMMQEESVVTSMEVIEGEAAKYVGLNTPATIRY